MDFTFISPTKIFFGSSHLNNLSKIIDSYNFKRILFHYGNKSIKNNGLYDKIVAELNKSQAIFFELGGVQANPDISLVRKGVALCKKENVDFILAVGGGSVIDSAKAIASGVKVDFDPWKFSLHEETVKSALPVGVILTIAAAGSELSNSCVISNREVSIKNGFNSDLIRPLFVIEDPALTYTVSPYQTMCGVVDIMMHTLERYLTDVAPNKVADEMAIGLLKAVMKAGVIVKDNPTDYEARSTLMLASSYSHNGLTGLGGKMYFTVHKIEHVLSGLYPNIAHGAGLSVLFVAWAKHVYKYLPERFYDLAIKVFDVNPNIDHEIAILVALENLKSFYKYLDMPVSFSDLNENIDPILMANTLTKNKTTKVVGFHELDYDDLMTIFVLCR